MKKTLNILKIGGVFIAALLVFAGCNNMMTPKDNNGSLPGTGTVLLSFDGTQGVSRTALPDEKNGFTYDLRFTAAGKTTVEKTNYNQDDSITLETGTWKLDVTAKSGAKAVGTGSVASVTVTEDNATSVKVRIVPITANAADTGTLAWNVTFSPEYVADATLSVGKFGATADHTIDLKGTGDHEGANSTIGLAPGSYLVRAALTSSEVDNKKAGYSEIVHIYPGLTTTLYWEFDDVDFVETKDVTVSATINSVMARINKVSLGGYDHQFHGAPMVSTATDTWTVNIEIPLSDTTLDLHLIIETEHYTFATPVQTALAVAAGDPDTVTMADVELVSVHGDLAFGEITVAFDHTLDEHGHDVSKHFSDTFSGTFQVDMLPETDVTLTVSTQGTGKQVATLMSGTTNPWTGTISVDTEITATFETMELSTETLFVDFEDSAWNDSGYAARTVTFDGFKWTLAGVVGTPLAADRYEDTKSIRLQGNAVECRVELHEDNYLPGIESISFKYAKYGTDTNGEITLYYIYEDSEEDDWKPVEKISVPAWSGAMENYSKNFNEIDEYENQPVRFKIQITLYSVAGSRVNIDDIVITYYGDPSVEVTNVALKPKTLALDVDDAATLNVIMTPSVASKNVTWASSNTAVATVDDDGIVTAVGVGDATITVTTVNGDHSDTCAVTVSPKLMGIAVTTSPGKTIYYVGESLDITGLVVTGTYSEGDPKIIPNNNFDFDYDFSGEGENIPVTVTFKGTSIITTFTVTVEAMPEGTATLKIDFEDTTLWNNATAYTQRSPVKDGGYTWIVAGANGATDGSDRFHDKRSIRFNGRTNATGPDECRVELVDYFTNGIESISFYCGRYATDTNVADIALTLYYQLENESDDTWYPVGESVTPGVWSGNMEFVSRELNIQESVRFKIQSSVGSGTTQRRTNVDDIVITYYTE